MRITYVPHALEQMERRGISEEEVAAVLADPNEEGPANFGRLYAQSVIGHRRVRVVYNWGADEAVVVSVMFRRREGGGS
jgi:Domain of unknown function (DUF4258)